MAEAVAPGANVADQVDGKRQRVPANFTAAAPSNGNSEAAITRLKNIVADHPADRDALEALTGFYNQRGNIAEAEKYAARLRALLENDKPS